MTWIPGTVWIILATSALKWQRMSFRVSESLSFSASSNCLVRSTYSSNVLFREWLSPSNPPLALKEGLKRKLIMAIMTSCKILHAFYSYCPKIKCFLHTSDWWHQHQPTAQISGPAGPWGRHDACVASYSVGASEWHFNLGNHQSLTHTYGPVLRQNQSLDTLTSGLLSRASFMMGLSSSIKSLKGKNVYDKQRLSWMCVNPVSSNHLKATGLVLPSPSTRDSVMSMLSERIIGTMCLKREDGDGVPTIYYRKQKKYVRTEIWNIGRNFYLVNLFFCF